MAPSRGPIAQQLANGSQELEQTMGSSLSARRQYTLTKYDHRARPAERAAHRQFLCGKQRLVEAAHRVERFPGAEQVGTGGQSAEAHDESKRRHQHADRQREWLIEAEKGASPDGTMLDRREGGSECSSVDEGVRVYEDQEVAGGGASAGIPGAGDLPVVDRDHARSGRARNLRRPVCRRVVNDKQLVRSADFSGGRVERRERAAQQLLLVMGRDDERNHAAHDYRQVRAEAVFAIWPHGASRVCRTCAADCRKQHTAVNLQERAW